MKHYTTEELELFRNGEMSLLGRMTCSRHLKECPECRKRLEELQKDDEFVQELRASIELYSELSKDGKKQREKTA